MGAGAIIGSEVAMQVGVATEMAAYVLRQLLDGAKVGEALYRARWNLARKRNLLGLAYTAYGLTDYAATAPQTLPAPKAVATA